jgi:anaphase-promoting complex subunit 2
LGVLDIADRSSSAIWILDDLIKAVGPVGQSSSLKVLSTWVDHGILIEDPEFTFNLLERVDL